MGNKARGINSPVIKQLLDETTPEELAKIDTEMTNNKQQTAVEWFGMEMGKLFAQYHGKIICIGEFHKKRFELEEQAKEMEKQQIINAVDDQNNYDSWPSSIPTLGEQYYNKTYK